MGVGFCGSMRTGMELHTRLEILLRMNKIAAQADPSRVRVTCPCAVKPDPSYLELADMSVHFFCLIHK